MTGFNTGFSGKRASNGYHTKKKGKKGKNKKQNDSHNNHNNHKDNNKPITAVSDRNWSMMPAPFLDTKLITALKFPVFPGSTFQLTGRVHAYEAHCQDRQPNSYYVQIAGGSKYIAYVSGDKNLQITGEALRKSTDVKGYIYHSTVIPYHKTTDLTHDPTHGYITFMIPFEHAAMVPGLKSYVCAVKLDTYVETADKADFLTKYRKYIMSTNIDLESVNIRQPVLDTLKKTLHDIMDSTVTKELHRTDTPWGLYAGTTANVSQMIRIQNNQYMMMQCVIPYKKVTADYAKTVLARIAKKFLGIINSNAWKSAMVDSYYPNTAGEHWWEKWNAVKMKCIAKLWDVTTFVLAGQLHLSSMDKDRTNNMANIFVKFMPTYLKSKACPKPDLLKTAIETDQLKRKNSRNDAAKSDNANEFDTEEYTYEARTPDPKKLSKAKRAELDGEDLDHVAHDLLEFNDYSQYGDVAKRDWA